MANQTEILKGGIRGRIGRWNSRRYAPNMESRPPAPGRKKAVRRVIKAFFTCVACRRPSGPEDPIADYLSKRACMMKRTGLVD